MTLSIEHLAAGYGSRLVLSDISVSTISDGAFVGLIGPNASGKSTFFKTLAGLIPARGGTIDLNGDDVTHMRRRDRSKRLSLIHI